MSRSRPLVWLALLALLALLFASADASSARERFRKLLDARKIASKACRGPLEGDCVPKHLTMMRNENEYTNILDCDPNIWSAMVWGEEESRDLKVNVRDSLTVAKYYDYKGRTSDAQGLPNTAMINIVRDSTQNEYLMVTYNTKAKQGITGSAGTVQVRFRGDFMLAHTQVIVKDDPDDKYDWDGFGKGSLLNTWTAEESDGWVIGPIKKESLGCFNMVFENWQVPPQFTVKLGWGDEIPASSVKEINICQPGCF